MIKNTNESVVKAIENRLTITHGYCPCSPLRDDDHICPCKKFRELEECCCGLFIKEN